MKTISLSVQAHRARLRAIQRRNLIEHHDTLASRGKWPAESIDFERSELAEDQAVAETMTWLDESPVAAELRKALRERAGEAA